MKGGEPEIPKGCWKLVLPFRYKLIALSTGGWDAEGGEVLLEMKGSAELKAGHIFQRRTLLNVSNEMKVRFCCPPFNSQMLVKFNTS